MKKKKKKTTGIPLHLHNVFSVIKTLEAKAVHIKKKCHRKRRTLIFQLLNKQAKIRPEEKEDYFFRGTQMMRLEWAENEFSTKCICFLLLEIVTNMGNFALR